MAAKLTHFVDWRSDDLVLVFFNLLADKLRDGAAQHFADNPYRNANIPDLIGMVLDRNFIAVAPSLPPDRPTR